MRSSWMNTPIYELFLPASYVEHLHTCTEFMCELAKLGLVLATCIGVGVVSGLIISAIVYVARFVVRGLKQHNILKLDTLQEEVNTVMAIGGLIAMLLGCAVISTIKINGGFPPPTLGTQSKP